jgi:hypothetical protein
MDGLTCHDSDTVEDFCFENECFLQFLPPHSSDQVQPCDQGIFGTMRTNIAWMRPGQDFSRQTTQVVKIFGAMQTTILPPTIILACTQTGIRSRFAQEHNCLICSVDLSSARCARGSGASPLGQWLLTIIHLIIYPEDYILYSYELGQLSTTFMGWLSRIWITHKMEHFWIVSNCDGSQVRQIMPEFPDGFMG